MESEAFTRMLQAELLQRHAEIVKAARDRCDRAVAEREAADHAYLIALSNQAAAKKFILDNATQEKGNG